MIKYSYRDKYLRVKDNQEFWGDWSEELFTNKTELESMLQEGIDSNKDNTWCYSKVIEYEIKEVEPVGMNVEGFVDDYGEYEDYTVVVGDNKIERTIINNYKGQKIRIHIDVLD